MNIMFYYNSGTRKYGAELYVLGKDKVNIYFTGDTQITYFIRMMKDMYPLTVSFHPTITDVTKPYLQQLVTRG